MAASNKDAHNIYQPPEVFVIGRASEVVLGRVKVAPPPDKVASSNLSMGGNSDESATSK